MMRATIPLKAFVWDTPAGEPQIYSSPWLIIYLGNPALPGQIAQKNSRGSTELLNQIGPGVSDLWSDKQTNRQTNRDHYVL